MLPSGQRMKCKLLNLTFKDFGNQVPIYLFDPHLLVSSPWGSHQIILPVGLQLYFMLSNFNYIFFIREG